MKVSGQLDTPATFSPEKDLPVPTRQRFVTRINISALAWNLIRTVLPVDSHCTDCEQVPEKAKGFSSSLSVQTGSEAHPASYPKCTGGPLSWVKHGRDVTLTTYVHLMPMSRMSRSYASSPS
jgi:hypothetical protein